MPKDQSLLSEPFEILTDQQSQGIGNGFIGGAKFRREFPSNVSSSRTTAKAEREWYPRSFISCFGLTTGRSAEAWMSSNSSIWRAVARHVFKRHPPGVYRLQLHFGGLVIEKRG